MRLLKFRVWNKNRNMFIIDGMTPKEIQDDATQSMELPIMTSEDCVWQQYTGLKDKNGVEIYEGDILGYFDAIVNNDKERVEIKWAKAYSGEQWCEFNIRDYNGKDVKSDEPNDYYGGIHPEYKEVIGNIFEGVDK